MGSKTILDQLGDTRPLSIGIDVSKTSLVVGVIADAKQWVFTIDNTPAAVRQLSEALVALGYTGKLVLEATGYYHWCAALGLSKAGLDVRLVNPLMASKHARSAIRKTKTDPVDAIGLGHMALTERRLPPAFNKDSLDVRLRHLMGLVQKLDKTLQSVNAALKDFQAACDCVEQPSDTAALSGLQATVKQLHADKAALVAEFDAQASRQHGQTTHLYQSVPGVSAHTAAVMQLMLDVQAGRPGAWVAYCGLDLSVRQSGTWKGRSRLTKRGNPYLRKRLFQAAWGAKMHDPDFKAYYDRLRRENRSYKEAIVIIARKLLRICFQLAQSQQPYDRNLAWA